MIRLLEEIGEVRFNSLSIFIPAIIQFHCLWTSLGGIGCSQKPAIVSFTPQVRRRWSLLTRMLTAQASKKLTPKPPSPSCTQQPQLASWIEQWLREEETRQEPNRSLECSGFVLSCKDTVYNFGQAIWWNHNKKQNIEYKTCKKQQQIAVCSLQFDVRCWNALGIHLAAFLASSFNLGILEQIGLGGQALWYPCVPLPSHLQLCRQGTWLDMLDQLPDWPAWASRSFLALVFCLHFGMLLPTGQVLPWLRCKPM